MSKRMLILTIYMLILSNVYFDTIKIGDNIICQKESVDTNHLYVNVIKCYFDNINIGDDIIKCLKESVDTNHLFVDIIKCLFLITST